MTAEYQTEIKKFDERWHANYVTKIIGFVVAPAWLGAAIIVPDPELKRTFASLALICGGVDGVFLAQDAMIGSVKKKIRETLGKQKSS